MTPSRSYEELQPSPVLNRWLAAYWYFEADDSVSEVDHHIPPNGGMMLTVVPNHDIYLSGPRTEPHSVKIRRGMRVWGAIFWPGTSASITGVRPNDLLNLALPGKQILPSKLIQQFDTLVNGGVEKHLIAPALDRFFGSIVDEAKPLDEPIMQAVFKIIQSRGEARVNCIAADIGLSERQFRRRFRDQVGLSPKELLRIQRFRSCAKASVSNPGHSWVELAARLGYSDQPHLAREFQKLIGMTPKQFEKHFHSIDHKNLIR